ncbi:hypothetical protein RI367_002080 [Sorochytrium milnesiophthora]
MTVEGRMTAALRSDDDGGGGGNDAARIRRERSVSRPDEPSNIGDVSTSNLPLVGTTERLSASAAAPVRTTNADRFKMGKTNAAAAMKTKESNTDKLKKKVKPENVFVGNLSPERKQWIFIVAVLTCWVPNWALTLGGIRGQEVKQAWREKFALCLMVLIASFVCVGWLEVSSSLLCPKLSSAYTVDDVKFAKNNNLVIVQGKVLDITKSTTGLRSVLSKYAGMDVSSMFPSFALLGHSYANSTTYTDPTIATCIGNNSAVADSWLFERIAGDWNMMLNISSTGRLSGCLMPGRTNMTETCYVSQTARDDVARMTIGDVLLSKTGLAKNVSDTSIPDYTIIQNKVYDMTQYFRFSIILSGADVYVNSWSQVNPIVRPQQSFLPADMTIAMVRNIGTDMSVLYNQHQLAWQDALACMDKLFYVGEVTPDAFVQICSFGNPLLMAISGLVYSIVIIKFAVSLMFAFRPMAPRMDAFCVCFVPCYTEGFSMRVTLETLADCDYDDRKKLLVVVCDGNITGKGNPKPTPRIALDILGWNGQEPDPQYYVALGKGSDKINMAKVYSGIYEYKQHRVPYLVVAKVGKADEAKKAKPGNRGKRDSQLILMNFFNKIVADKPRELTPLEFDLYYNIRHVIGVDPKKYEYCLMVDADTEVDPLSMNELVASMVIDRRRIGVCGETQVSNKWASWVTWIQVHEYYINHHLGKTFESMFGSVTCLPGCFSMYRVWYPDGEPALVADAIIEDYKVNKVHTLHSKNLLHLGEDRYLTTLLLKHFPDKRLEFIPSALCRTDIPDSFAVLLSQRRRWINSTFHNLYEVMKLPRLCSFCFVSMKTLVAMDLMSTMILPASTVYLYILIIRAIINGIGQYTMVIIGACGLYVTHLVIILLVKKQYEYVLWITVYIILAMPVFSIVLPAYAFWHFDDFSWGNTRQVQGVKDDGHHDAGAEGEVRNITQLPVTEWEQEDPRMRAVPDVHERFVNIITRHMHTKDGFTKDRNSLGDIVSPNTAVARQFAPPAAPMFVATAPMMSPMSPQQHAIVAPAALETPSADGHQGQQMPAMPMAPASPMMMYQMPNGQVAMMQMPMMMAMPTVTAPQPTVAVQHAPAPASTTDTSHLPVLSGPSAMTDDHTMRSSVSVPTAADIPEVKFDFSDVM